MRCAEPARRESAQEQGKRFPVASLSRKGLLRAAAQAISGTGFSGAVAIRPPVETERYVHEQYKLSDKLVTALGIRQ